MTLALALLAVPLIASFAGLLLAAIDPPDALPPRVTDRTSCTPLRGIHPPGGKEQRLQAAPHRGRLIAWSGSIWRAR